MLFACQLDMSGAIWI